MDKNFNISTVKNPKLNMEKNSKIQKERKLMYFLMICLVIIWSFDYIAAKHVLEVMDPLVLLYIKYTVALGFMLIIKRFTDRGWKFYKRDILTLIVCSVLGEILYFFCEYTAMDYLPVSIISILLAFVPALSIGLEIIIYKKKPSTKLVAGLVICGIGVALVIGVDFKDLLGGRIIGYLLVLGAIFSWNAYNFITAALHDRYSSIYLTVLQLSCVLVTLAPYMIFNVPSPLTFTPDIIGGIIYLGVFGAGLGFLIQVRALHVIGPTATSLFSNFLPISTTGLGWLFLNETISGIQILGGIVIITSGYFVIKEKGKMEELQVEG
jgi:drug/metabolite transporter (DMT)-like permease